ncbi:MAG: hypothetical protein B6D68_01780 [spirochete symbiont of Stewartia floridana]|nr:MAG: hypothetical protein B6D68_01780 [spirochete symbiont of Stewartia floridana]
MTVPDAFFTEVGRTGIDSCFNLLERPASGCRPLVGISCSSHESAFGRGVDHVKGLSADDE